MSDGTFLIVAAAFITAWGLLIWWANDLYTGPWTSTGYSQMDQENE